MRIRTVQWNPHQRLRLKLDQTIYTNGRTVSPHARFPMEAVNSLTNIECERRVAAVTHEEISVLAGRRELRGWLPAFSAALAAPVPFGGTVKAGILIVESDKAAQSNPVDGEVLGALAKQNAIALDSVRFEENRRDLARLEERNRLARDLHDSVSQILFSLTMTAKGTESLLSRRESDKLLSAVQDYPIPLEKRSKGNAFLIMHPRPDGLESGLVTALRAYGEKHNLRINTQLTGFRDLPRIVEEALWRIGQEALNNVTKHAGTFEAELDLQLKPHGAGRFSLTSVYRKGTTVEVAIPLA